MTSQKKKHIATGFLRSRVARRFFLLFICCALLPMLVLTILSFNQVNRQLEQQSHKRLQEQTKSYGMAVYERLLRLDTDLEGAASFIKMDGTVSNGGNQFRNRLTQRFIAIKQQNASGSLIDITAHMEKLPDLTPTEKDNIRAGKTVIVADPQPGQPARLFIIKPIHSGSPEEFTLFGEIIPSYVWGLGTENLQPAQTELFVLDMSKRVLMNSHAVPEDLALKITLHQADATSRQFEYVHDNETYIASYWPIFLKSNFFARNWIVVLGQAKTEALSPLAQFRKTFPLVVLLSLWIVLLLSLVYIRRTLAPVEILKEGTRKVAERDFSTRVKVTSGDEFQDLAFSFNNMTNQLDQQFKAMSTSAEIDRAILSSLDSGRIINTALTGMYNFFDCELVAFGLINPVQGNTARFFSLQNSQQKKPATQTIKISEADSEKLATNAKYLLCHSPESAPHFLSSFTEAGFQSFLLLPIFLKNSLAGCVTMGSRRECAVTDEKLMQARHFTDQLAVALSNSRLIEDMEHLTLGTIEALARTVDAKSSWTSGHSERVAETAVKIATAMGWGDNELAILFRGGLLHDIGKIGIPVTILDKPGKLTDEEYIKIKDHPAIGAKILEPINAYADIIPMVVQHHERFDGKGYPGGLAGQEIDINARVLAVADVYDALISSRPYRQGWIQEKVVNLLKNEAGKQFDPDVVEVFLSVLATDSMRI